MRGSLSLQEPILIMFKGSTQLSSRRSVSRVMLVYFAPLQQYLACSALRTQSHRFQMLPYRPVNFPVVAWLFVFTRRQCNVFAYRPRDRTRNYRSAYSVIAAHQVHTVQPWSPTSCRSTSTAIYLHSHWHWVRAVSCPMNSPVKQSGASGCAVPRRPKQACLPPQPRAMSPANHTDTNNPSSMKRQISMATPRSIFSRKRDLIYLAFFIIHVPVLFCELAHPYSYQTVSCKHTIN
jgi:hypothetical protein